MANCIRVQVLRKVEKFRFNGESQFSNIFFSNMQSHNRSYNIYTDFLFSIFYTDFLRIFYDYFWLSVEV